MFTIRLAQAGDLDSVVRLYQTVEKDSHLLLCKPECLMEPVQTAFLEHSIAHGQLFVGFWNDELVGSVVINHEPHPECRQVHWSLAMDEAHVGIIHCLAILPKYQSLGQGRELLVQAARRVHRQGIKVLRYDVLKSDIPLQHLVAQSGFRFCETVMRRLCDRKSYPYGMYELVLVPTRG